MALLVLPLMAACSRQESYPDHWSPVMVLKPGQCPDLDGSYSISDEAMYRAIASHYDKEPRKWSVVTIGGDPQSELRMRLYEAGTGAPIEEAVRRRRGSDYDCDDGWLRMRWPAGMPLFSEDDKLPDGEQFDKSISFAKNRSGELVARIELAHWKGVSVWCGDGCKYLPIPFTRQSSYSWSRWTVSAIPERRFDVPATTGTSVDNAAYSLTPAQKAAAKAWEAEQQQRRTASIAQREREERIVKLLLPNLPKDMVLTNFSTRGQGFVAELRHLDKGSFEQLLERLRDSGNFVDAELGDWKYVDGYGRQVADVTLTVRSQEDDGTTASAVGR